MDGRAGGAGGTAGAGGAGLVHFVAYQVPPWAIVAHIVPTQVREKRHFLLNASLHEVPGYQRLSLCVAVGDVPTAHPGDGGPDHLSVVSGARSVPVAGYAAQAREQRDL